jgi:hypothetical protein
LRLIRDLRLESGMVVPLQVRGRCFGAITFIYADSGRRYGQDDLSFAEDFARRAAMAIENAIALKDAEQARMREQALRSQAELANRAKDEFLATVSHELRPRRSSGGAPARSRSRRMTKGRPSASARARSLTPLLIVISMITGDFLSMLATTDNVKVSQAPNVWNVGHLTTGGISLGFCDLIFCTRVLAVGKYHLGLGLEALQTLSIVTLIFSGQAILYVVRERRHLWSSRPSVWLIAASVADLLIISTLATRGILMKPLPVSVVAILFAVTVVFCFVLDLIKVRLFDRLQIV